MNGPTLKRARAKASRPSYRRGGLVLGQVDWVEFTEDSVDLVGLRALLGDSVVLIELATEAGDWVRLSAEQRAQALDVLPRPEQMVEDAALTIDPQGFFTGVPGEPQGVTEFGAMQAEIDDLKARLAEQRREISELKQQNAQLQAKAAARPPKPAPTAKAPKAPKAAPSPASPAPAEKPAAPAAEAPPAEVAPQS
jgi:hypothetical protein